MLNATLEILAALSRIETSAVITQDLLQRLLDATSSTAGGSTNDRVLQTLSPDRREIMLALLNAALDEGYMSTKEVCEYVGISDRTLNRKVKEGMIQAKDTQGVEKYYTKSDVLLFYRRYHRKMPRTMP